MQVRDKYTFGITLPIRAINFHTKGYKGLYFKLKTMENAFKKGDFSYSYSSLRILTRTYAFWLLHISLHINKPNKKT